MERTINKRIEVADKLANRFINAAEKANNINERAYLTTAAFYYNIKTEKLMNIEKVAIEMDRTIQFIDETNLRLLMLEKKMSDTENLYKQLNSILAASINDTNSFLRKREADLKKSN